MPTIRVNTSSDSLITIVPLDSAHQSLVPDALVPVLSTFPSGSFLLVNHTSEAITAVVALWSFSDTSGAPSIKRINCDGYLDSPPQEIVKPNSMSLIAPNRCLREDLFSKLSTGNLLGLSFSDISSKNVGHTEVEIVVDSVIFKDGRIWGPDKKRYFEDIWERHLALKSVATDIRSAKDAGRDERRLLQTIRSDGESRHDKYSTFRAQYASLLQRSPNLEGTLQFLESHPAPPEFTHIGASKK